MDVHRQVSVTVILPICDQSGNVRLGKLRISRNLQKNRIGVVRLEAVCYQLRSINCGKKGIITAENFGALMISYSEIGGHVLTPFLGTCP